MKSHQYKKSTIVLYIFHLLLEGRTITIKDLHNKFEIPKNTLYKYLLDIEIFIDEFYLTGYYEFIRDKEKIRIKKNRKVIDNYHFYLKSFLFSRFLEKSFVIMYM